MAERSLFWNGVVTGDATDAPYDANTEFANWVRQTIGVANTRANAGIVLGTGTESFNIDSLQVIQNSPAGMSVLLYIGAAIVHGTTYYNDAALTVSVAANGSGNPRIDTLVLRKSWAAQTVRAAILQGTPAASPSAPSLTQSDGVTWEIPIADIAVANAAVSITAANITQRAEYTNAADGVYLDRLANNSPVVLTTGAAVVLDAASDRSVKRTATGNDPRTAGFWQGRTSPAGRGRVLNRGIGYVNAASAVTRGQYGYMLAATQTTVTATDQRMMNSICIFLETTSVAGPALAFIDAGLGAQYGPIAPASRLAAPAASIVISGWSNVYNTLVVEFYLRSVTAALSDTVLFRWNGDAVAANYYNYTAFIANSTPATTAIQNLAATAGTNFSIPGATGTPASSYAYGTMHVNNAAQAAESKHISGHYYLQLTNVNGGLLVGQIGGRHSDTNQITSLTATLVSGANFATGSYISIYAKQTWES